jgi:hypothetical protein
VEQLTKNLRRNNEFLYIHLVDCYLCCAYAYIKMHQQFEEVQNLMDQVLVVEPDNVEALFMRCLASIAIQDSDKA